MTCTVRQEQLAACAAGCLNRTGCSCPPAVVAAVVAIPVVAAVVAAIVVAAPVVVIQQVPAGGIPHNVGHGAGDALVSAAAPATCTSGSLLNVQARDKRIR